MAFAGMPPKAAADRLAPAARSSKPKRVRLRMKATATPTTTARRMDPV